MEAETASRLVAVVVGASRLLAAGRCFPPAAVSVARAGLKPPRYDKGSRLKAGWETPPGTRRTDVAGT